MSDVKSCTELQKKKILSILQSDQKETELHACAIAKLFSSKSDGRVWFYSDLDGILCFLVDFEHKTTYLTLFDVFSFEKLFQYELYIDFSKYWFNLAPNFRCFEVEAGFIGFQFDLDNEAEFFDVCIKKFSGRFLQNIFSNQRFSKQKEEENKQRAEKFVETLRNSWADNEEIKKYDENYLEDGMELEKSRNLEILNNISFNTNTKEFEIGEISEELKSILVSCGLRKKLLKNREFAFQIFKKIILGIGGGGGSQIRQIGNIPHEFLSPEEKEKLEKEEQSTQGPNQVRKQSKKSPLPQQNAAKKPAPKQVPKAKPKIVKKPAPKPQLSKTSATIPQPPTNTSVPTPPPVPTASPSTKVPSAPTPPPVSSAGGSVPTPPPLNIPTPPPMNFTVMTPSKTLEPIAEEETTGMSREEELASIKLKKVEVSEQPKELSMYEQLQNVKLKKVTKDNTQKNLITKNEKNFLQNTLSMAIQNRFKNLHQHDEDEDDDEDDDDW